MILHDLTESEPKAYPKRQKEKWTNTSPQTIRLEMTSTVSSSFPNRWQLSHLYWYRITVSSLLKQLIYTNYPRDSESKFSSVLVASIFEFGYDHSLCSLYYQSNEKKKKSAHPKSLFCLLPRVCPNP